MDKRLFHPQYWLLWLALGIVRIMVLLPYRFNMWLGQQLGYVFYYFAAGRRKIAKINIDACFEGQSSAWREQVLKKHFKLMGQTFFEMPFSWWSPAKRLAPLFQIKGLENLEAAKAKGKGVLLLSAHFTSLEMGGMLLIQKASFGVMYRQHKNPVIEYIMGGSRKRILEFAVAKDDVRGLIKKLRTNRTIWYAPDQNSPRKAGIFADFFGISASSNTATARLAKMTGAPVVPFRLIHRDDDSGYDLIIEPELSDYPTGDLQADTQRVNDLIENWVREYPAQYLWVHRRFRTRPDRNDRTFYK